MEDGPNIRFTIADQHFFQTGPPINAEVASDMDIANIGERLDRPGGASCGPSPFEGSNEARHFGSPAPFPALPLITRLFFITLILPATYRHGCAHAVAAKAASLSWHHVGQFEMQGVH